MSAPLSPNALPAVIAAILRGIKGPTCCAEKFADPASRLWRDLHIDHIDLMSLALELEDRLGLIVGDDALLALVTVGDVIALAQAAHIETAEGSLLPTGRAGGGTPAPPAILFGSPPCAAHSGRSA